MEYNSVDLFVEESGQGTPLVFLHGYPLDHSIWLPLAPLLAPWARVILPDLRGSGKSPVPAGVYSMRQMAEDVVRLLDHLELEKAVVLGHSMGGYVALAFAQAYPARLAGLGLIATQAAADTPERRQNRLKTAALVKRRGAKVVAESMVARLTARADLAAPLTELMLRASPQGIQGQLRGMAERADMTENLAEINVPTLVVAGGADQILPLEAQRTLAQMLPMGWLVEIPGAGHLLMMEEPRQAAEAILQLVQKVEQAA